MSLLLIVALAAGALGLAYWLYGGLLARLLQLDATRRTPAVEHRDDCDFAPLARLPLLNQHFSAIAAAGPVVGPILAGLMFGWLPALIWIVLGAIFIGGVHDQTALLASVRHRGRSIAFVVREHMTRRSYVLFLLFIWLALVYVVVAFTDITAASFVGLRTLESGEVVSGPGIATSSLLYLLLPVAMGLLIRFAKLPPTTAALVFLPLVGVSIWAGQLLPLDLAALLNLSDANAQRTWNVLLLAYCYAASIIPMWLLLQPRGNLGGWFLLIALVGGTAGLVLGGGRFTLEYPAFIAWQTSAGQPLFPLLFITVACGACSGFHAMVASGTTSKQLRRETDARPIGYGAMLMESMVAVLSLSCIMILAPASPLLAGHTPVPNFLYANGIGAYLGVFGVPAAFAVSFALMAFTTFVYDTLDVCTRLGRYCIEELTGWHGRYGRWFATAVTVGVPLYFLVLAPATANGQPVPVWRAFWSLFGASNQLLAALTLVGVTVWLWRTRRRRWVFAVTGLPALFMYVFSTWELVRTVRAGFANGLTGNPVPWVALVLIALALLMLVEAIAVFFRRDRAIGTAADPLAASA
ncbi:MAG: carbon starvation protein A [Phycisphaerae bacterium]